MSLSRRIRSVRHLLEYAAALPGYWFLRLLPYRCLPWLADIAGAVIYAVPRIRRVILANLAIAFPEMSLVERRRLARRNAAAVIMIFLEFIWFIKRPQILKEKILFHNWCREIAERCREKGQSLIWAVPHLGNWELAGLIFRHEIGTPFAVVVRPFDNPWLDRLVRAGRESEGTRIIPDKGAVRGIMKAMREGFHFATLIDQNTRVRDGGVFIDFFGLPAPTSRAPALFSRKLDALVAVGGCLRRAGGKFEIFHRLLPRPARDYSDDASLIQDLMRLTEEVIRENPEQYLWMYERWRYVPAEAPDELAARYPFYAIQAPPRFYDANAPK